MVLQITDTKSLRLLARRLDENNEQLSRVKGYMLAILDYNGLPNHYRNSLGEEVPYIHVTSEVLTDLNNLLELKKVKENQHLTAILLEARELYPDLDAMKKVFKRVLEVPQAVPQSRPSGATEGRSTKHEVGEGSQ